MLKLYTYALSTSDTSSFNRTYVITFPKIEIINLAKIRHYNEIWDITRVTYLPIRLEVTLAKSNKLNNFRSSTVSIKTIWNWRFLIHHARGNTRPQVMLYLRWVLRYFGDFTMIKERKITDHNHKFDICNFYADSTTTKFPSFTLLSQIIILYIKYHHEFV